MNKGMCWLHKIAGALVIVGALNWGLLGAFEINLIGVILDDFDWAQRALFVLVGISGLVMLFACKCCMKGKK